MSVNLIDRKESKVEFDNNYFRVYDDAVSLITNNFGANEEWAEERKGYIGVMGNKVLSAVSDIGTHIRIANSIYPKFQSELEERRIHQEKAIGLCFDLLTKYQLIMHELRVRDDKFTNEIKNIIHEINCLKKWRNSDNKRFNNLG